MPKKKSAPAKTAPAKITKASFVKSQPAGASAKDILAKGKEAGMTLTTKYVYTVRSNAKQAARKPGRPLGSKNKAVAVVKAKPSSGNIEDLLRAAASEIGLSRAISILSDQRSALRAVLGN